MTGKPVNEEEFKDINDCATIKKLIGSGNYKKIIAPLIEKHEKVQSHLNRLMLLSLALAGAMLVPSVFYEMESNKKISEVQKLELNIKENKVFQADCPHIEQQIASFKSNSKENHDMAVFLGRNITSVFMILSFISMIGISAHNCISKKRIRKQVWEIYKNQQNTRK